LRFCELMEKRSVTEFNYRYDDLKAAQVFVGLAQGGGRTERDSLIKTIADAGFAVRDMTDNEMAKLHVRYMVGGHARGLTDERLYRFEFPERPGALMHFLTRMGSDWNISLFHYRNHGADVGRVLVGLQVPERSRPALRRFLREIGYDYTDESRNPAYRFFLK